MTSRFVWLVLIAVMVTTLPFSASAQTENKTTSVFEIKNVHAFLTGTSKPEDQVEKVDPISINTPILQSYLEQKGSPLAPYAKDLLQNQNWKLVLAISNGESTMCKHQLYNNCWGVGGAWNLKRYKSFVEGFSDVDQLLTNKYISEGKDTPTEIVHKYVGHANSNWVLAVNKVLADLDNLPLVN